MGFSTTEASREPFTQAVMVMGSASTRVVVVRVFNRRRLWRFGRLLTVAPLLEFPLCGSVPAPPISKAAAFYRSVSSGFSVVASIDTGGILKQLRQLLFGSRRLHAFVTVLGCVIGRHGVSLDLCSHPSTTFVHLNPCGGAARFVLQVWRLSGLDLAMIQPVSALFLALVVIVVQLAFSDFR